MPEKLSIIIDILSAMAFITNELRLWGSYNYGKRLISWSSKNHQSKAEALRGDIERAYSKIYEFIYNKYLIELNQIKEMTNVELSMFFPDQYEYQISYLLAENIENLIKMITIKKNNLFII